MEKNNENTICVVNITEINEIKETGEQIIKSVINHIIDQCCNQSESTHFIEALDKTVNSQTKKLVRRKRRDPNT